MLLIIKVTNFIPVALFLQFKRFSNIFFLALAVVQFFPQFQSLDPFVAALPFILVLIATMAKEGVEDWKRHASDNTINTQKCLTIMQYLNVNTPTCGKAQTPNTNQVGVINSEKKWAPIFWKDLAVGEFVLIHENDQIPADVLLLSSSEKDGYI
jgi:phospholipid-translocating ATPase